MVELAHPPEQIRVAQVEHLSDPKLRATEETAEISRQGELIRNHVAAGGLVVANAENSDTLMFIPKVQRLGRVPVRNFKGLVYIPHESSRH